MKSAPAAKPIEPDKLRPILHEKIEHMDGRHLTLLNRILLQFEAEELAEKLGQDFDHDHDQELFQRVPELIKQFRDEHRHA